MGTNAITHTASAERGFTLALTLTEADGAVTISVNDAGGAASTPHVEHPATDATHGRGLTLIAACATRVEVHGDHHGYTVTAELRTPVREPRPC